MYSISQEIRTRFCCALFVVVMQSFIINSHEVFIHIHQGCFPGTGAIVRLPQCQWSEPDGYGKISQCISTTKHSKAKPCAYFLGYTVVPTNIRLLYTWWRNKMVIFSALLALCEENSPTIPLTKASEAELWCFLWSAPKQTVEQSIDMPVIWDAIVLIMTAV